MNRRFKFGNVLIFVIKFSFLPMRLSDYELVPVGKVCNVEILAVMMTLVQVFWLCFTTFSWVFSKGSNFGLDKKEYDVHLVALSYCCIMVRSSKGPFIYPMNSLY